jgi:hypothetical protein
MSCRAFVLATVLAAACSSPSAPVIQDKIVIALSIDWEGAVISDEALDALDGLRKAFGDAPLTHFVSAAYFTKQEPDADAALTIAEAIRKGDELAVHLHAWESLARKAGVTPRSSPSFLTGTDQVADVQGELGFDIDLDTYSIPELRAMVRTTRDLLREQLRLPISRTFRAGGYLGTPKLLRAVHAEGFAVDSSATNHKQFQDRVVSERLKELWPDVTGTTGPFQIPVPGGEIQEMPIAAIADYQNAQEIVAVVEGAQAALAKQPGRNVFVVLAFHFETATDFGSRLRDALATLRARPELERALFFTTVEHAAYLARMQ